MKKHTIIFDMDGVIFDTERIYRDIWIEIYARHGYTMTNDIYKTLIGRDRKSIIDILKKRYGENYKGMEIFDECDYNLKKVIDDGKVPLKYGALEIFKYLKNNNYKMAIATSSPKTKLEMQLKIHALEDIFDAIICADDVTKSKPDPEIFLVAAKKLNSEPCDCIVIEDSPAGIKAAFNAGMTAIHVEDLVEADDDIKNYSEKQFKNLIQVMEYLNLRA